MANPNPRTSTLRKTHKQTGGGRQAARAGQQQRDELGGGDGELFTQGVRQGDGAKCTRRLHFDAFRGAGGWYAVVYGGGLGGWVEC